MQSARGQPAAQTQQQKKLLSSYQELLSVFESQELNSVGNYTLGRLIGKGSFGKVYLATHKLTNGSKVVLKSAKKDDPNLAREIHHHRQFLHPHIARLYEVIVTETLVWLVLEYCPGDELYNYLLRHGALPAEKVQRIFAQLVGAVAYVHNKSCVHRDLKLENILLDKFENVKLVDFGFTREYEKMKNHLQTFCGTVCYSAPEMLRGEKYAGEKVDVWSLGIILFALLAGELPFDEDDDMATKHKILASEPAYPESMAPEAKALISKLLSKRPLIRPSLSDILSDPFLAEHAPAQQAILKLARPAPFATLLEKDCLQRMRSAGVDIDRVIENVLAQRMDALGGWWSLLIEKEERKAARRERKRKEKELEMKSLRRISAASSRMMTPTLREVDEEAAMSPHSRGRQNRRSGPASPQIIIPDLPRLPEGSSISPLQPNTPPPPPPKNGSVRSVSSSRHRPPLPSKDREIRRRSRPNSQLTLTQETVLPRRRGRRSNVTFLFSSLKHWIVELPKRARSPHSNKAGSDRPQSRDPSSKSPSTIKQQRGIHTPAVVPQATPTSNRIVSSNLAGPHALQQGLQHERSPLSTPPLTTPRQRPSVHASSGMLASRPSLSPAPVTPHSTYRRSSAGLRGRKSTSSSVSSIRSMHHVRTHSKTSSTSSNVDSVISAFGPGFGTGLESKSSSRDRSGSAHPRSPHSPAAGSSVKILPATPTAGSFPAGIRVARGPPAPLHLASLHSGFLPGAGLTFSPPGSGGAGNGGATGGVAGASGSSAWSPGGLASPGLPMVFAKRKRTPFKGPMLSLALEGGGNGLLRLGSGSGPRARSRDGSTSSGGGRRSTSLTRGHSAAGVAIAEEDEEDMAAPEEDEEEEDIEEVDAFSPIEVEDGEVEIYEMPAPEIESGVGRVIEEGDESAEIEGVEGKPHSAQLRP